MPPQLLLSLLEDFGVGSADLRGQRYLIRIVAKGNRGQTWINGEAVADIVNEDVYKTNSRGMLGLQIHKVKAGTDPYEIAWKNIRIIELEDER